MKFNCSHVTTVFLGLWICVKSATECNLECEPGYICRLRRGECTYPPCPWFPTCHQMSRHHTNHGPHSRHERRHTRRPMSQRHRNRHMQSALGALLPSPEVSTNTFVATERPGQCPVLQGPCITTCRNDGDCPADKKCCNTGCGQTCRSSVEGIIEKPGTCPRQLEFIFTEDCSRECFSDLDCGGLEKCCRTGCGSQCTQPCFYWIHPNQRSGRKSIWWKLPFVCRS